MLNGIRNGYLGSTADLIWSGLSLPWKTGVGIAKGLERGPVRQQLTGLGFTLAAYSLGGLYLSRRYDDLFQQDWPTDHIPTSSLAMGAIGFYGARKGLSYLSGKWKDSVKKNAAARTIDESNAMLSHFAIREFVEHARISPFMGFSMFTGIDLYGYEPNATGTGATRRWLAFGNRGIFAGTEKMRNSRFNKAFGGKIFGKATESMFGIGLPIQWGINALTLLGDVASMNLSEVAAPLNKEGFAKAVARTVGSEIGSSIGLSLGPSLGYALLGGPAGAMAGMIGLGAIGAIAGTMAAEIPGMIAEYGKSQRKIRSTFIDSQGAATMRQQSLEMLTRSQMNARSGLGREAVMYHS